MSFQLSEDAVDSSLELSLDHNDQLPSSAFNLTKEDDSCSKIAPLINQHNQSHSQIQNNTYDFLQDSKFMKGSALNDLSEFMLSRDTVNHLDKEQI